MRHGFNRRLPLMLLPLALSGCCTYLTVDNSTHALMHDRVQRIEKAGVTGGDKLVIFVEGSKAESLRVGQYTIAVTLPTNEDFVRVPQEGMTKGWNGGALSRTNTLPVTVGVPVKLSAYETIPGEQKRLWENAETDRALYLIQHFSPDDGTSLFYVEHEPHLRSIEIIPDSRDAKTPWRYPFLLIVPVSVALDAVTWPVQLYVFYTWGDVPRFSVTPIPPGQQMPNNNGQQPP